MGGTVNIFPRRRRGRRRRGMTMRMRMTNRVKRENLKRIMVLRNMRGISKWAKKMAVGEGRFGFVRLAGPKIVVGISN